MYKYIKKMIYLWLTTGVLLAACTPAETPIAPGQSAPPFPLPGQLGTSPQVYHLEDGWHNGEKISYYNFGTNTPLNP